MDYLLARGGTCIRRGKGRIFSCVDEAQHGFWQTFDETVQCIKSRDTRFSHDREGVGIAVVRIVRGHRHPSPSGDALQNIMHQLKIRSQLAVNGHQLVVTIHLTVLSMFV